MSVDGKRITFIVYLAALAAFAPFSTDIYLASMPTIQQVFHTTPENVQLTLSLFFVGFAIAQLFWGPLSDRIGRKAVVLIGLITYVIGSLLCAWSTNISWLITARIIQSIGACSGVVMALTIVKDSFTDGKEMSKILSRMMSTMAIAPIVAPIIGSYLLVHINWQASFYCLVGYGALLILGALFVKESCPKQKRQPLPVNKLCHAYFEQIKYIPFLLAVVAVATNFSMLFAFIASSSFIYIKIYHLATHLFGYFFAINASSMILGFLSLSKLKTKLRDRHIILIGLLISFVGITLMFVTIHFDGNSIWSIVIPLFFVTYGMAILFPEITSYALRHVIAYAGLSSSLLGTFRFTLAAAVGFLMGFLITKTAMPLAVVMLIFNLLTTVCMVFYFRCFGGKQEV